jgi:hypothetical protein
LADGLIVKLGVGMSVLVRLKSIGLSTGFKVNPGVGLAVIITGLLDGFIAGLKLNVGRALGLDVGNLVCLSGVVSLKISYILLAWIWEMASSANAVEFPSCVTIRRMSAASSPPPETKAAIFDCSIQLEVWKGERKIKALRHTFTCL